MDYSNEAMILRRLMMQRKRNEMIVTATYNVTSTTTATQILDNVALFDTTQITRMAIDGVMCATANTHVFSATGSHTVVFYFDKDKFYSLYCAWRGCKQLTTIDFSDFDLTTCISLNCTFHGCINLQGVDLSGQNTSNVTSLAYMFWNDDDTIIHKLSYINFQGCNFSNVTSMYGTFRGLHSLYSLNFIDMKTSTKLTTCFALFNCCYKLPSLYLGAINTTNVTNMSYMFGSCLALTSVTFKTPINQVTTYNNVFYNVPTTGTLYYPSAYSFTKLINQLPSKWSYYAN